MSGLAQAPLPPGQDVKQPNGNGAAGRGGGGARPPYKPPSLCTKCWRKLCPFCCAPSLAEMQKEKEREQRQAARKKEQEATLASVKKDEKPRPTSFYYKIDKISATFEHAHNNVFFEFEVGGQELERETEEMVQTMIKKKRVDRNGQTTEVEVPKNTYKKRTQVNRPPAGRHDTRFKASVKAKTPTPWVQEFSGVWEGTYKDMEVEYLTVRVWEYNAYTSNRLVGMSRELMEDVARSKMDRLIHIFKHDEKGIGEKEHAVTLNFKFELQEKYSFLIDFRDWEVQGLSADAVDEDEENKQDADSGGYRRLTFGLERSRASCFDDLELCALKATCYACGVFRKRGDDCVLPIQHGSSRAKTGSLSYPGTRAWLEDETLTLTLSQTLCYKLCKAVFCLKYLCPCLYKYPLATSKVNLQGMIDYGHVVTEMDVSKKITCLSVLCPCLERRDATTMETVRVKGAVACPTLPLHRQLGNVDPAAGSGWLNSQAAETFLVVRVLRAKGLFSLGEFKENLNPNVIIEFSGLRKQTRTILSSSDPVWDDDIYFKIADRQVNFFQEMFECDCFGMCKATHPQVPKEFKHWKDTDRTSVVQLSVWDNDGLSKNPLGYCSISFRDIWFGRDSEKMVRSLNGTGDKVKRACYEGKFALKTPSDGSARQTGPKTANQLIEERNPTRFLEFMCYFERADNQVVAPESRAKGEADDPANQIHAPGGPLSGQGLDGKDVKDWKGAKSGETGELSAAAIERALAYWNLALDLVPDRTKRYMTLYGRDEYTGQFHFLPRFVKPMNPPSDIQRYDQLLYYIYSIETVKKATKKPDVASLGNSEPWVWSDPFFFLEKRKGDVKDHAILLCNFLLGMKREAYVCIGSASSMSGREEPHVWVMTLEPSRDECAKANPPILEENRVVRFWETTNGRSYTLPGRFVPRPMPVSAAGLGGSGASKLDDPSAALLGEGKGKDDDDDDDDPAAGASKDAADGGVLNQKNVEDVKVLEKRAKQLAEVVKKGGGSVDYASSAAAADAKAKALAQSKADEKYGGNKAARQAAREEAERKEKEQAARDAEELSPEREKMDDAASLMDSAYASTTAFAVAAAAGPAGASVGGAAVVLPKSGVKLAGSESLFDSKLKSRIELERQTLEHQRQLQKPFKDEHSFEAQQMRSGARTTPYWSIDIVFNNRQLYANLQPRDPETIKYNLTDKPRWKRFGLKECKQIFKMEAVNSFYPDKALVSLKAGTREVETLERSITERIKDTIRIHRSYQCSLDTIFLDQFGFQHRDETASQYVMLRLEFEAKFGERDEALHQLQNEKDAADAQEDAKDKPNEVRKQKEKRASWLDKITRNLERGYCYSEKLFHFKHTDGNRISDVVLDKCRVVGGTPADRAKKDILEIDDQRKPKFVVGCKITQMPAHISPVRVFVAVICKDGSVIDL